MVFVVWLSTAILSQKLVVVTGDSRHAISGVHTLYIA